MLPMDQVRKNAVHKVPIMGHQDSEEELQKYLEPGQAVSILQEQNTWPECIQPCRALVTKTQVKLKGTKRSASKSYVVCRPKARQ